MKQYTNMIRDQGERRSKQVSTKGRFQISGVHKEGRFQAAGERMHEALSSELGATPRHPPKHKLRSAWRWTPNAANYASTTQMMADPQSEKSVSISEICGNPLSPATPPVVAKFLFEIQMSSRA
jgi:hypothetical protein